MEFVTGDKKEIYTMARKSYLAVKLGKPSELYDMVHTENFVLVDAKRRVRGFMTVLIKRISKN
jgi:protein SCO1/2